MIKVFAFCAILLGSSVFSEQIYDNYEVITDIPFDMAGAKPKHFPTVTELIKSHGYPVETHEVQTEDGYLLTMHRIPHGLAPETGPAPNKRIAFLQHGILCSSADWVVTGPETGLAYLLADKGYDVWMGNARGNTHSKAHITLNPSSSEFWKFSWHEIGIYDLPAMIDYALKETGQNRLYYTGHSQGTTVLFVMLSLRPEYNEKIILANALAPVSYIRNMKSPFFKAMAPFVFIFDKIASLLGINEFAPSSAMLQLGGSILCRDQSIFQEICANVLFLICGFDSDQLNKTILPQISYYTPAGASTKQFVHYGQLYNSGKFRQYDHGWLGNMQNYHTFTPPDYPIERITAPIALYYSKNDWLAAVKDVEQLQSRIENILVKSYNVPYEKFNHLDFLWAIDVKTLVHNHVITLMDEFTES